MPECRKEVLEDFPRRMREWLDHIIRLISFRHYYFSFISFIHLYTEIFIVNEKALHRPVQRILCEA